MSVCVGRVYVTLCVCLWSMCECVWGRRFLSMSTRCNGHVILSQSECEDHRGKRED